MKHFLLAIACAAMGLTSYAQFTLDPAAACGFRYKQPCPGGTAGYSMSDATSGTFYIPNSTTVDVHGSLNGTVPNHYAVGFYLNGTDNDFYYVKKDKTSGIPTPWLFDINTEVNNQIGIKLTGATGISDDKPEKMTVDETNSRAFVVGELNSSTNNVPFIMCLNIGGSPNISWALPISPTGTSGNATVKDVTIDGSGNVYVLMNYDTVVSGNTYFETKIEKFSGSGTWLGKWSSFGLGSSTSVFECNAMEWDNSSTLFIAGAGSITGGASGPFLAGISTSLSLSNYIIYTGAANLGEFFAIDQDPSTGHMVVAGSWNTPPPSSTYYVTWSDWNVALPSYTLTSSGMSTSGDELIYDLLVEPSGKYVMTVHNFSTSGLAGFWLTTVDPTLNGGLGDIDYSSAAYQFPAFGGPLNKDFDGSIIVGGADLSIGTAGISFTAKFHDVGLTSWTGYESKSSTNIKQASKNTGFALYPNPANNDVTVKLSNAVSETNYRITNALGQSITTGVITKGKNEATIDINNLACGNYYMQLFTDKKVIGTQMFVKQ